MKKLITAFRWGAIYLIAVATGFALWALFELAAIFATG